MPLPPRFTKVLVPLPRPVITRDEGENQQNYCPINSCQCMSMLTEDLAPDGKESETVCDKATATDDSEHEDEDWDNAMADYFPDPGDMNERMLNARFAPSSRPSTSFAHTIWTARQHQRSFMGLPLPKDRTPDWCMTCRTSLTRGTLLLLLGLGRTDDVRRGVLTWGIGSGNVRPT